MQVFHNLIFKWEQALGFQKIIYILVMRINLLETYCEARDVPADPKVLSNELHMMEISNFLSWHLMMHVTARDAKYTLALSPQNSGNGKHHQSVKIYKICFNQKNFTHTSSRVSAHAFSTLEFLSFP